MAGPPPPDGPPPAPPIFAFKGAGTGLLLLALCGVCAFVPSLMADVNDTFNDLADSGIFLIAALVFLLLAVWRLLRIDKIRLESTVVAIKYKAYKLRLPWDELALVSVERQSTDAYFVAQPLQGSYLMQEPLVRQLWRDDLGGIALDLKRLRRAPDQLAAALPPPPTSRR